ncbi:CDP-glycerol glycerophosphotransferase family protein [uncultured Amphritea sp.]|uniref:CDP-glycerol glycerophosphotransferase family protein n=1 Tax=uncultured Amphritea sp. TaxID=981605 RepID=UPI002609E498|nr:CDP-glycerol glycerophosphotransferase family protein [uncultured Amphritea sp.]
MKKIVIVTYGGGHINMLLPIIRQLTNESDIILCILALTTAGKVLEREGIEHLGFRDLLVGSDDEAVENGIRLLGPEAEFSPVGYDESVAYMGLSYLDMETRLGKIAAKELFQDKGRQAFYQLTVMEKFLTHQQPDLVIATNSPRCEKAALDAAGNLNIPSICLVDLFALQESEWICKNSYASKVCVLSKYVKNILVEKGRRAGDVVVTGNPAFDPLSTLDRKVLRQQTREKLGCSEYERIILWASSVEPAIHPFTNRKGDITLPERVRDELVRITNSSSKYRLVIRPHPSEQVPKLSGRKNVFLSTQEQSIEEVLTAADVVIVFASTVGIQAAYLEKPLINVRLSVFADDAPYDEMGLSAPVYKLEELGGVIDSLLKQKKPISGLLPPVGQATQKVVKEIKCMLGL